MRKKPTKEKSETVRLGGPIDRNKVCLRVFGDDLDPDIISQMLQHDPSYQIRKGEKIVGRHSRYERISPVGSWQLVSDQSEKVPIEKHIFCLLTRLNKNLEVWEELSQKYSVDLFCGLFLDEAFNRGFSLSPEVSQAVAERKIILDFDIYSIGLPEPCKNYELV